MHPSPAFRSDPDDARAIVEAHPFATVSVNGVAGPVIALAPFVPERNGEGGISALIGHVSRVNPFWEALENGPVDAVALFQGANAYVSPSLYPSKAEHGRAVPTWNYVAAQARGPLSLETAPERMMDYLRPLTQRMEAGRPAPWRIEDAPAEYTEKLFRGIVGLRLTVRSLIGVRKLSQNKSDADFSSVLSSFETSPVPGERAIGEEMKQMERL